MGMSKNIQDYVKVYNDFISPDLAQKLVSQLELAEWNQHTFYDSINKIYRSYENELSISYSEIDGKKELMQAIWNALQKYFSEDIQNVSAWFDGWSGHTSVRFNKYDPTTQMKLHCDHIHSMFDGERKGIPTLTVLGSLNNDYTGGEFIMWEDEVIELPARSVIVFPSNFLYPHEVRPVKSGTRYSYVSWAW